MLWNKIRLLRILFSLFPFHAQIPSDDDSNPPTFTSYISNEGIASYLDSIGFGRFNEQCSSTIQDLSLPAPLEEGEFGSEENRLRGLAVFARSSIRERVQAVREILRCVRWAAFAVSA